MGREGDAVSQGDTMRRRYRDTEKLPQFLTFRRSAATEESNAMKQLSIVSTMKREMRLEG